MDIQEDASLLSDLNICSKRHDLQWGRRIHAGAVATGSRLSVYVIAALIHMYARCGSMGDARHVFDSFQKPNVVCWNALLQGYAVNGQGMTTLNLFSAMKERGCTPDRVTYIAVLKACASLAMNKDTRRACLKQGKSIHFEIGSLQLTNHVQNTLVDMYAKCGSMVDAQNVFNNIHTPDVVSWTALLLGYTANGEGKAALDLFYKMKATGCIPDSVSNVAALKACTSLAVNGNAKEKEYFLECGRNIHSQLCHPLDHYLQGALIDMYVNCGSIVDARRVFDSVQKPGVVSWTALIMGYVENGEGEVALDLFSGMKVSGCNPDSVTYVAALKACTSLAMTTNCKRKQQFLKYGKEIHLEVGCHLNSYVKNTLIDMYAKYDRIVEAHRVFDSVDRPDVVAWNALILGYATSGEGHLALDLFGEMKARKQPPDYVTYVAALKACISLAVNQDHCGKEAILELGRSIHSEIGSLHSSCHVHGTLIDMYSKCGSMEDARRVFESSEKPDTVSWNALLMGYVDSGEADIALRWFARMKAQGCIPDSRTYVAALKACTTLAANGDWCLEWGRKIHTEIGCNSDVYVQNALIDMYAKCGSMTEAHGVFERIQVPNVVSWTTLLMAYVEYGEGHAALDLFSKMKASGCVPDSIAYIGVIKACGLTGELALGRKIHAEVTEFTAHIVTCLISLYSKSGRMVDARQVFDSHPKARDVSAWNALLTGYANVGDTNSVFDLFKAMQDHGFRPNSITLVCILLCCSHSGLVEKAREYFEACRDLTVSVTHYTCMVDVLGRANQLSEAIAYIRKMPCISDAMSWKIILGACCKWKNVEIGRLAFGVLVDMNMSDASDYVLMAQVYGSKGMLEEQERILTRKADTRLNKATI